MALVVTDNSAAAKAAIKSTVEAFLHEVGGEIVSRTARNSRVDTGQTKGSYEYKVVSSDGTSTATIGSTLQNAIWEEYGTGEFAINGDGRKGGWVYADAKGNYYHTKGKKPNKPMQRALESVQSTLESNLSRRLKKL